MLNATLDGINAEILKYQSLTQGDGDTRIIPHTNAEANNIVSDELLFEEDQIHLYLSFNPAIKKIKCIIFITEINPDFVEKTIRKVGLPITEENIRNYQRDPTLIERFWNEKFIDKYNELLKYFRKSKMVCQYREKFPPAFNKNRNNEIVDNYG